MRVTILKLSKKIQKKQLMQYYKYKLLEFTSRHSSQQTIMKVERANEFHVYLFIKSL